jgi:hypothetical protein
MASNESTGSNIQHTALAEHNTSTVPSATVVDTDGAVVVDAGGAVVVDADGVAVANEDAMPIAIVDYRQPMSFVSRGLGSWSGHSAPLGVHRASPCPTTLIPIVVNNIAVHRIMEHMGYNAGHGLGLHH